MKQPAFFIDLTACMDGHDLPPGTPWRRVAEYCGGDWCELPGNCYGQNVFSYYVSVSCNHCLDPVCVRVCPTTPMRKGPDGIVSVNHDL